MDAEIQVETMTASAAMADVAVIAPPTGGDKPFTAAEILVGFSPASLVLGSPQATVPFENTEETTNARA